MNTPHKKATLLLEDGSVHTGISIGADGLRVGELVFNTAMTGYQEILSDPSYAGQMICFTSPHIGIIGVNDTDNESKKIYATGLVIRDYSQCHSNWRSQGDLHDYLLKNDVVGISEIDTRQITRQLRVSGTLRAVIFSDDIDIKEATEKLQASHDLSGVDLAQVVTTDKAYPWNEGVYRVGKKNKIPKSAWRVLAYDFGIKRNILRFLTDNGCEVHTVPAQTPLQEAMQKFDGTPDGVFLSNGPGDPEPCDYAIAAIRELLTAKIPVFGICLGCQLLGLAGGAKTRKMKFGHHGANHPVIDLESKRVFITSQNHNFCIDEKSLPSSMTVTHRSLFDGSIQGVRHNDAPAFGFQGHPEAGPGPNDMSPLFETFTQLMQAHAKKN